MNDLNLKIDELVKAADEITAAYWHRQQYTFAPAPTHRVEYLSAKWARILVVEHSNNGGAHDSSVYGFVALKDNATKTLGIIRAGDIHKAATYKAPAKHARGNVFSPNFRDCLTPQGIAYIRRY